MGVLFKGVCYPSPVEAKRDFCSSWHQQFSTPSNAVELRCAGETSSGFTITRYLDGQLQAGTTVGTWPDFPECDYSGGAALASEWAAIGFTVLVVIYCGKQLIRIFETPHTEG